MISGAGCLAGGSVAGVNGRAALWMMPWPWREHSIGSPTGALLPAGSIPAVEASQDGRSNSSCTWLFPSIAVFVRCLSALGRNLTGHQTEITERMKPESLFPLTMLTVQRREIA